MDFKVTKRYSSACVVVFIWLSGIFCGTWWQIGRFIETETKFYTAQFNAAVSAVTQRLNQNEALLDGLVALLRSSNDHSFTKLRLYANELLQHYPHLHTIGYQPRVLTIEREKFEHKMALSLGRPFTIRTFDFNGERKWQQAKERPFYFPVTFMAPELFDARDVIGYDVYDDSRFRDAINASGRQNGAAVATLPFDLVEGGRGYIYLRAVNVGHDNVTAIPAHLISILIRTDKLFTGIALSKEATLALYVNPAVAANELIGTVGEQERPFSAVGRLAQMPLLELSHTIASPSQPFQLRYSVRPSWVNFDWDLWLIWLLTWTILTYDICLLMFVVPRPLK